MNPYLHQPYIGLSSTGNPIEGVILHAGAHEKITQAALNYVVQLYQGGIAVVSAASVKAHVDGLELVASMEKDKE